MTDKTTDLGIAKSRRLVGVAIVFVVAWLMFPLMFEVARRFESAHAASDSEGGTFFWALMSILASGWFTCSMLMAALAAGVAAVRWRNGQRGRYRAAIGIAVAALGSIVAHLTVDGADTVWNGIVPGAISLAFFGILAAMLVAAICAARWGWRRFWEICVRRAG